MLHPARRSSAKVLLAPLLLALPLAIAGGCTDDSGAPTGATRPLPEPPRLVLLYATCTVNKHYLEPYDEKIAFTPNFARFGAESAVLSSHRTESGVSGTAFASIFSGTQADRHGVFKHPQELDGDLLLIFEAFRDAGYQTFYWSAHPMAAPGLAYAQGVDPRNAINRPLRGDDTRLATLLARLRDDPSRRALVVTAFSVTHAPWDLQDLPRFRKEHPEEVGGLSPSDVIESFGLFRRNRFALQTNVRGSVAELGLAPEQVERLGAVLDLLYKTKIALLDETFGSVVDAIDAAGLRDESLVVFTADHGQQMDEGERFRWTHGPDLAPDVIDVPWIVRGPGDAIPPRRIDAVTRSIDVFPTLAGLAGVPIPPDAGVAGVDLSAALQGVEPFPDLTAYSHGTLRSWSYFQPDLIENIWATARRGDRLYTWRREDDAWTFDAERVEDGRVAGALDADAPEARAAARDLWAYRTAMIDAFRRDHPDEPQSKDEELGRLRRDEADALRELGYIE